LTIKSTSHTTRRYFLCAYILVFCMPVNIQLSKISIASAISSIYSNKLPKNFSTTNEHEWTQIKPCLCSATASAPRGRRVFPGIAERDVRRAGQCARALVRRKNLYHK